MAPHRHLPSGTQSLSPEVTALQPPQHQSAPTRQPQAFPPPNTATTRHLVRSLQQLLLSGDLKSIQPMHGSCKSTCILLISRVHSLPGMPQQANRQLRSRCSWERMDKHAQNPVVVAPRHNTHAQARGVADQHRHRRVHMAMDTSTRGIAACP